MMKKLKLLTALVAITAMFWAVGKGVSAHSWGFTVEPQVFDPFHTHLVAAEWEDGIGCPTNATTRPFNSAPPFQLLGPTPYTDPACTTGDTNDERNEGLLLVKTGPTLNDAAAGAVLHGVKGVMVTELGYDIRKPGPVIPLVDPRGSHCGNGAPRFNIVLDGQPNDIYFLGCNAPPPDTDAAGTGWQRLRWGVTSHLMAYKNGLVLTDIKNSKVASIEIIFDEGDDTGPDNFGAAVLDNIDVNGTLVGRGPEKDEEKDNGGHGDSLTDDRPSHHHH